MPFRRWAQLSCAQRERLSDRVQHRPKWIRHSFCPPTGPSELHRFLWSCTRLYNDFLQPYEWHLHIQSCERRRGIRYAMAICSRGEFIVSFSKWRAVSRLVWRSIRSPMRLFLPGHYRVYHRSRDRLHRLLDYLLTHTWLYWFQLRLWNMHFH